MKMFGVTAALGLALLALAPMSSGPASAQGARSYPTVRPFVFSLIHPKYLVGHFRPNAPWKCVASDGYAAFIAYNTSRSRARRDLAAVGFPTAVCNHKR